MITIAIFFVMIYYSKSFIKKLELIIDEYKHCHVLTDEHKERIFKLKEKEELKNTRTELQLMYDNTFYAHHKKTIKIMLNFVNTKLSLFNS